MEHGRVSREASCGQDPLDDLDAATPGSPCHSSLGASPGPRLGGLTDPEFGECSRIGPGLADVLRLARVSDRQSPTGQQSRLESGNVARVDGRAGAQLDLRGAAIEPSNPLRP